MPQGAFGFMSAAEITMRRWLTRAEGTAAVAAGLGLVVVVLVAGLTAGWPSAGSAGLGVADVVVFFCLGAIADAWVMRHIDWSGGALIIAFFGLRIALLSLVAVLLAKTPWLASVTWFGIGVVVATMAWVAGLIVGHVRGRWPIYDIDVNPAGAPCMVKREVSA